MLVISSFEKIAARYVYIYLFLARYLPEKPRAVATLRRRLTTAGGGTSEGGVLALLNDEVNSVASRSRLNDGGRP